MRQLGFVEAFIDISILMIAAVSLLSYVFVQSYNLFSSGVDTGFYSDCSITFKSLS